MAEIISEKKKTSIISNKTSKVYVYNVLTKEWRSRICELNGSYLSFYRKEKIVAVIDLEQVGDISPVTDMPVDDILKGTVFSITLKEDRNFTIRTISSEECISWISILQEVRDKLRSQLSRKSNVSSVTSSLLPDVVHNTFDRLMNDDQDSVIDNCSSDKIEEYFDNEVKLDGNILSPIPISQEHCATAVDAKLQATVGSVSNKKRFSFSAALSNTFSLGSTALSSPNNFISPPQGRRVSFSFPMTNKQLIPLSNNSQLRVKSNESVLHGNNSNHAAKAITSTTQANNLKDFNTSITNTILTANPSKAHVSILSPKDKNRSDTVIAVDENKENVHVNTQSEDNKSVSMVVPPLMSPLLNEAEVTSTTSTHTTEVDQEGNVVHMASISTSPMNNYNDASHGFIAPSVNARTPNYRTPERRTLLVNKTSLGTQTPNFRRPLKAPYQSFNVWTSSVPMSYVIIMVAVAVLVGSFISSCYVTQHYEAAIRNGHLITAANTASTTINLLPNIKPSPVSSNSPFARNLREIQTKSSSSSYSSNRDDNSASSSLDVDIAESNTMNRLVGKGMSQQPGAEVVVRQSKSPTYPLQLLLYILRHSLRLMSGMKGRIASFFHVK